MSMQLDRGGALHLLRLVIRGDGTDAYKTKGKTPVSGVVWPLMEVMQILGLVTLDESTAPVSAQPPHGLLRGWASLTEKGHTMLELAEQCL